MQYIPNVVFALILVVGIGYFAQNIKQLIANIRLGKKPLVKGDKKERLINIEKKLQAITTLKQNQVKNEIQEQVTKRVLDVEQKLTEQIKSYEWEVR